MSTKFKWTQTDITRCHELQVDRFVRDFPVYSEFVTAHGLTGKGSIILANEGVELAKRYFDVSITLHNPGEIFSDLRSMGKVALDNRHDPVEGFMSPEFRGSDKFYIALSAFHNKSVTPTATLIHELGHLVEEQVRLDTNKFTSSAYDRAREVLHINGMSSGEEHHLHHLANEWVAWVNSIWISKLLDIEIQHSILGMIMDERGWQGSHNNTVSRSIARLVKFIDSKHTVRHRLATAETVGIRCLLINEMSSHFFYLASMKRLPVLDALEPVVPDQACRESEEANRC